MSICCFQKEARPNVSVLMSTGGSIRRFDVMLDWFYTHVCISGSTFWCSSHYFTVLYYQDTLTQQICILRFFENTLSDQYQIIYRYMLLVDNSVGCSRCRHDAFKCFRCWNIWLNSCSPSFRFACISFPVIYLHSLRTLLYSGVLWLVVYDVY